jgi:hypothetical protein
LAFLTAYSISLLINAKSPFQSASYLVSSHSRAENGPHNNRVNIIRQHREIISAYGDIFLEASVSMMQVVQLLGTILLFCSQAIVASMANMGYERDADIATNFDILRNSRAQGHDAANTLVPSYMR